MEHFSTLDLVAACCIIAAAMIPAIDGAIGQSEHLRKHVPRLLTGIRSYVPLLLLLIGGSAYAYEKAHPASILDLPPSAKEGSPFALVQGWGVSNEVFYAVIKPNKSVLSDVKLKKMVLVVSISYANIDPMTDKAIAVSQGYTILDGFMTLAIPFVQAQKLRISPDKPLSVTMTIVEIPFVFTPEQITSLSDVGALGGSILGAVSVGTTFLSRPPAINPQAACPPSPAPQGTPGKT